MKPSTPNNWRLGTFDTTYCLSCRLGPCGEVSESNAPEMHFEISDAVTSCSDKTHPRCCRLMEWGCIQTERARERERESQRLCNVKRQTALRTLKLFGGGSDMGTLNETLVNGTKD